MKQLLQCCQNQALLVALNDRAFLVRLEGNDMKESDGSEQPLLVVELLPPSPAKPNNNNNNDNDNYNADTKEEKASIQAVAVQLSLDQDDKKNCFLCAVSRADKFLALYRVSFDHHEAPTTAVQPTLVHPTNKRVACMCFARVPASATPQSNNYNNKYNEGLEVILTGDLIGDAWAYNVHGVSSQRRLLLGHTASMLTGIQVCNDLLLTADRDEKIRVTCFPDTSIIQGYLLGHEAYLSSMDAVPVRSQKQQQQHHQQPLSTCVSCSGGDGTVRLWDYQTMKLLATWRTPTFLDDNNNMTETPVNDTSNVEEKSDTKQEENNAEKQNDNDDNVSSRYSSSRIPSRVAMSRDGTLVAVIYDQWNTLHILGVAHTNQSLPSTEQQQQVPTESSNNRAECTSSLELVQTIDCPDQPLALSFSDDGRLFVSMKDPTYLQVYTPSSLTGEENSTALAETMIPGILALQKMATAASIQMPNGVLERDKHGLPTLTKKSESRGGAGAARSVEEMPWNSAARKDIAKERNKRHSKRRKKDGQQETKRQQKRQRGNSTNTNGTTAATTITAQKK